MNLTPRSAAQRAEVRPLREADLPQLFALRQIAFLDRSDFTKPGTRARHVARLPYTWGHFEVDPLAEAPGEGVLSSAAVMYPFEMYLAGSRVPVGGLAGVLSAPEHRRRGGVKALLARLLAALRDAGTGWCLEYPFDPRFYARYGFATVTNGAELRVPSERLYRGPAPAGARRAELQDAPRLAPIYAAWAAQHTFTLVRGDGLAAQGGRPGWPRVMGGPEGSEGPRFTYLLGDAYCILELTEGASGQTLVVHDYAYSTPAGYEALWTFVGSFHGQVHHTEVHLPDDDPLLLDLRGYSTNQLPLLQARVVEVGRALEAFSGSSPATFALEVLDPFCPWNARTFGVDLGPQTHVAPTNAVPDLTLDIRTLTLLLCGTLSAAAAARAGLVRGDPKAARALAALSGDHRPFMPTSDYF